MAKGSCAAFALERATRESLRLLRVSWKWVKELQESEHSSVRYSGISIQGHSSSYHCPIVVLFLFQLKPAHHRGLEKLEDCICDLLAIRPQRSDCVVSINHVVADSRLLALLL